MEQQNILSIHRARQLAVKQRTALVNQIRGLLMEYGVIIPKNIRQLNHLPVILELNQHKLNEMSLELFQELYAAYKHIDGRIEQMNKKIKVLSCEDTRCKLLMDIPGVGPITASAAVATVGDVNVFKNGREMASYLGLVPKQHSSGGTLRLSGISKRGDKYLRTLLVHGARSVIKICEHKKDKLHRWALDKKERCGYNKSSVALANKNARIMWVMLKTGECYRYVLANENV